MMPPCPVSVRQIHTRCLSLMAIGTRPLSYSHSINSSGISMYTTIFPWPQICRLCQTARTFASLQSSSLMQIQNTNCPAPTPVTSDQRHWYVDFACCHRNNNWTLVTPSSRWIDDSTAAVSTGRHLEQCYHRPWGRTLHKRGWDQSQKQPSELGSRHSYKGFC